MTTTERPFHVLHLRLPGWRAACGHRNAHRALPYKPDSLSQGHSFGEIAERERCLKCNARYGMMQAAAARRAAREAQQTGGAS